MVPVAVDVTVMRRVLPGGIEVEPAAVMVTVDGVAAVTFTLTTDDVADAPLLSVTRAVRDAAPVAVGVHDIV